MAISARTAQLLNQRKQFSTYNRFNSGRIPVGSLASTTNTLAKRTVDTELSSKIKQYNDGLISNAEMKSYLTSIAGNTLLSAQDRVDVADKIRDFDHKINIEKFEATYKNAPENSMAKTNAAIALANYYTSYASSLQADTPAYSTAAQKAGQWKQQSINEQDKVEKSARSLKRAQLFREVANAAPNSVEEAQQKAQAFTLLAQQARTDGDETQALQLETQAANATNQIPLIQARDERATEAETKRQSADRRKQIVETINQLANAYHDGKITAQEFAQVIPEIEQAAVEIGDTSIQLNLNKWSDSLAKDITKGVKRGTLDAGGGVSLPTVIGRGKGGGGAVSETDWDKQDFDYSDNLRVAKELMDAGKIDANKYAELVGKSVDERAQQLESRVQVIYDLAQTNPNTKVVYEGKKQRAADILVDLYKQQEDIQGQAQAFESGNAVLVAVAPNQFNASGGVKAKGKWQVTYQLVDKNQMEAGQYIPDGYGVYHEIKRKPVYLTDPNAIREAMQSGGYFIDENGVSQKVNFDKSGRAYYYGGGQYVEVYEPGTSNKKDVDITPDMKQIDDYAALTQKDVAQQQLKVKEASQAAELTKQQQLKNTPAGYTQISESIKVPMVEKGRPMSPVSKEDRNFKPAIDKSLPETVTSGPIQINPETAQAINKNIAGQIRVDNSGTRIETPQTQVSSQPVSAPIQQPRLQIAAPQPSAIQRVASQLPKINVPAPTAPVNPNFRSQPITVTNGQMSFQQPKPQPQQNIFQQAVSSVKNLASKIWPWKR